MIPALQALPLRCSDQGPGPVPTVVDVVYGISMVHVVVSVARDGAQGHAIAALRRESLALPMDHLKQAASAALDAWLMDYETQQGWPPRECMHRAEA